MMKPMLNRGLHVLALLALLASLFAAALVPTSDASACGAFAAPPSEGKLAASLPFLTVEQVLVMWDEETGIEDFIRETRFDQAGKSFGFVVPTPSKPEVSAAKPPFDKLRARYGFEDPRALKIGSGGGAVQGGGKGDAIPAVVVLSDQRIGSFRAFTLSASDPGAFDTWLRENGFAMTEGAKSWTRSYVDLGFFFVALRYDAPAASAGRGADAGAKAMTSETVRIRFKTPNPYYPYMEPVHEEASPEPARRMLTGWLVTRQRMRPIAFHAETGGKPSWERPWREGARYEVSSSVLGESLDADLRQLLPSSDNLVVQTFRDLKVTRERYGDVFLVSEQPESAATSAAVLGERRRLLGAVDPTLLPGADDAGVAEDAARSQPQLDAAPPASPAPPATHGCTLSPSSRDGSGWMGVLLVLTSIGFARRARKASAMALTACIALAGCRSRDTSSSVDAQAEAGVPVAPTRADREEQALALLAGNAPSGGIAEARDPGMRGLMGIGGGDVAPRGYVDVAATAAEPAPISDADRVAAGLRSRFRQCYYKGLDAEPKMAGTITLSADVAPNGEVTTTTVAARSGVSAIVATCCADILRRAQFAEPKVPTKLRVSLVLRRST
ncbi:MAG: hypothetical protein JWP87_4621 [Labilithrix sp.]|nr:hypothetical protein [Labilithrix sp.]